MNFLANNSYLAVKVEATEGVAVRPNVFLPVESFDVKTDRALSADKRMRGVRFKTTGLSEGERSHRGSFKVWGDADVIGYVLNMTLKKGSTTGNGTDGYTHPFTVDDPKTYTIEVPKGDFAQRFIGVRAETLKLMFEEAKLKLDVAVEAMGQFSSAQLSAAVTGGSTTTLKLNQEYDLQPNRGLVAADQLVIVKASDGTTETVTIDTAGVSTDGVTLTLTAAPTASFSIGDRVYLKKQTYSAPTLQAPLKFGDVLIGFGADATAAATAAAARSTATPVHALSLEFKNNLLKAPTTNYKDPSVIKPQSQECQLEIKQLFATAEQHQAWLATVKQAVVIRILGKIINAGTPTYNYLKITLNKVLLSDNAVPLAVGEYLMNEQKFEACYDETDGQAMAGELVNLTSTY